MAKSSKIRIFDTTLRDGEQTPGVSLTLEDKVQIANKLDELNVDVIEAGFPASSEGELKAVKRIVEEDLDIEVCGLARTKKEDVDSCLEADVDMIHTFVSTSDIQLKHTIEKSKEEVKKSVEDIVSYINSHNVRCLFSAMDATRTDQEFLKDIFSVAQKAGADAVNVPDTVGVVSPKEMEELIAKIDKAIDIPIDVHCHNDFGLAVANTLFGVEGGAQQVQVTINGVGERAGNASLQQTVMGLEYLFDKKTNINKKKLYETSKLVERLSGIQILPNEPFVGNNAFSHESGIHAQGVISDSKTFEPDMIEPKMIGHKRKLVPGKHMGKHSVKEILKNAGLEPNKEELKEILDRVKEIGDKGKRITEADLYTIAEVILGSEAEKLIDLEEIAVMTGNKVTPTASVEANVDGEKKRASKTGVGPVDAAIKATQSLVSNFPEIKLKSFKVEAITGGSDALAEIIIEVEDKQGRSVSAKSESEDIVKASVEALISGVNMLMAEKRREK
ncbi:2-isopropylmalate synthase [archaeon SCG-AAA382B04]|nr:2-isopropylmalate synthase [archaeon SCG-AAA382B04]